MNFESLPNEILLDLFDYLNGVDILHAFYGLNSRFNFLLYQQYRFYRFKFTSVSKRTFDMICQQHLPCISDRIITLSLSDFKETPEQINLFLSYISSFSQFTQLRSFLLFYIRSYEMLLKIILNCHNLCNLTHLYLYNCYFQIDQANFQLIINNIWSLPNLIDFRFDIRTQGQECFYAPTIISLSLKRLSIFGNKLKLNEINRLFEYTPHLTHILISIELFINDDYIPSLHPTLIDLNITTFYKSFNSNIKIFLQNIPNLRRLSIELVSEIIDGYQWEQIIRNYLPKLQILRLKMRDTLCSNQNIQERVDQLIDSFRSSFWIDEHQWFVQCLRRNSNIYLYTLSNTSNYYEEKLPDSWRSTYPHDDQYEFYNSMTRICSEAFFDQPFPSCIRLRNIEYLWIKLPISDQFWSIVSCLNRLYSLSVLSHTDTCQSQLQALLDRAPHLHKLSICHDASSPFPMSLFNYTNASVCELDLHDYNHCFNETQCITLTHSPLGVQCEVLSIYVNNRESIIYLVKNMMKLRVLHVQCKDDEDLEYLPLTMNDDQSRDGNTLNKDEVVQWLKDHLPSTYVIIKDPDMVSHILIWI